MKSIARKEMGVAENRRRAPMPDRFLYQRVEVFKTLWAAGRAKSAAEAVLFLDFEPVLG